jgi:lysine-specific demethylase/histidyl-hydroxylase NO66
VKPPAAADDAALSRCIACGSQVFSEQHWGRAPLLTRAVELAPPTRFGQRGPGFADLLDAAAIDELVSRRGLRTPFLRMAKDGAVLPTARFTRGGGAGASINDQAADDRVLATMHDGATLVLQALHRTWPPLVEFGSRLSAELGHPVQINAYITPPQSQGFAPHYDVHDVFVLQVAGRKHWRIHEPVVTDPLADQPWQTQRAQVASRTADDLPLIDTVLEPGDALYLPRGTIHSAAARGELSIHLTVGVHPLTRYDLVKHLLALAQQDPALRTSLPMGIDLADPGVLAPHLARTRALLQGRLIADTSDAVALRVGAALRQQTRPEPLGVLAQLAALDALSPSTPLRARPGLHARIATDAEITITLLDRTVSLPLNAGDAVKAALSGEVFTPAMLPGLSDEEQITAARTLLRDGLVVPG